MLEPNTTVFSMPSQHGLGPQTSYPKGKKKKKKSDIIKHMETSKTVTYGTYVTAKYPPRNPWAISINA